MKIGILTFHEADNYGALLQAYALQMMLKKLKAESEFVKLKKAKLITAMDTDRFKGPLGRLVMQQKKLREAKLQSFRDKYLEISQEYSLEEARRITEVYDCFVAGSDQVWNFNLPDTDERYFLPFAKAGQRYSYAASFGEDCIPDGKKAWIGEQLKLFSGISVREELGKKLVREMVDREAKVCLDPTMLWNESFWHKFTNVIDEQYVLVYMLNYDVELINEAKAVADACQLKLKVLTSEFMPTVPIKAWSSLGVEEWLSYINGAEYVFANSFHAIVFALLFKKNFRFCPLKGTMATRNNRILGLLKQLGLQKASERMITPDYAVVEVKLNALRKVSIDYLEDIVKNGTVN